MQIIETFGHYVENLTDTKPESARRLLKTGWEAQNLKFRFAPDKRLMPADRYLARSYDGYDAYAFGKTTGKSQ